MNRHRWTSKHYDRGMWRATCERCGVKRYTATPAYMHELGFERLFSRIYTLPDNEWDTLWKRPECTTQQRSK